MHNPLADACLKLQTLTPGKSGNISVRCEDGMLITPTGVPYAGLTDTDFVQVSTGGKWRESGYEPSSEWSMHLQVYKRRSDVGAVVHAHSRFATALACCHRPIPAFHYMVAVAGGENIPCAPYATFGTEELAENVARALVDRSACLMANHGQMTVGTTLDKALALAFEVEELAAQYWHALKLGDVNILSSEEMQTVIKKFRTYGQKRKSAA